MEKKIIKKKIDTIDLYDLEGTFAIAILYLETKHRELLDNYDNLELEVDYNRWDEDASYLDILGVRLETDAELEKKIEKDRKQKETEKKRKEGAKKAERTLYERLKKKYEK